VFTHVGSEAPVSSFSGVFGTTLADLEAGIKGEIVADGILPALEELRAAIVSVISFHVFVDIVKGCHLVFRCIEGLAYELPIGESRLNMGGCIVLIINRIRAHNNCPTSTPKCRG
jgi:hypothetical protein